jgi:predicted anti-sigma-YlaC factor YlaD
MIECAEAQAEISARLDGEPSRSDGALDDHLAGCADCRAFESGAAALRRAAIGPAPSPGGALTGRVLAALEPDRSTTPQARGIRIALVVVALVQGAVAIPELLHAGGGLPAHQSRHLGVFSLALAGGFLYTALRPRRAGAMLPIATLLGIGLVVTAVLDAAAGRTPITAESPHLLEVLGLVLVWMLTRLERPRPRVPYPLRPPDRTPR